MSSSKHVLNRRPVWPRNAKNWNRRHLEAYAAPKKGSTDSDFERIFALSHFGGVNHGRCFLIFCPWQPSLYQMLHSALNPTPETSNPYANTQAIFKKWPCSSFHRDSHNWFKSHCLNKVVDSSALSYIVDLILAKLLLCQRDGIPALQCHGSLLSLLQFLLHGSQVVFRIPETKTMYHQII